MDTTILMNPDPIAAPQAGTTKATLPQSAKASTAKTKSKAAPRGAIRVPYEAAAPIFLALIIAAPVACVTVALSLFESTFARSVATVIAAPAAVIAYGLTAGVLGFAFRRSIVRGKFERDLASRAYRDRRLYGLAWTSVYYAKPIYHAFLAVPILKKALFRLFGYSGSLDFTTYPDTWVRDLPLLSCGKGAYISNRATLGTNIVFPNGQILVDKVTIGENALVGHLCMLAPGSSLGDGAEVGVGSALGIRARVRAGAKIGPQTTIEHGVIVGEGTVIGIQSFVGAGTKIGAGLTIPPCTVIPARSVVETQRDVDQLVGRGSTVSRLFRQLRGTA